MPAFSSSTLSTNLQVERTPPQQPPLLPHTFHVWRPTSFCFRNLTNANHAIFLSPLLAVSKQAYDARETQAIGRIRRYGQVKLVHIYRFLTMDSVDETIFKERTGLGPNDDIEECTKVVDLGLY
jgi:hypothetical protein